MRRRRLKNESQETANGAQEEVRRLLISLPRRKSDYPVFRLSEVAGEVEEWKLPKDKAILSRKKPYGVISRESCG